MLWESISPDELNHYKENTGINLSKVNLNHSLILCDDVHCTDHCHTNAIDLMYDEISHALLESCDFLLQQPKRRFNQVPGWNDCVKEAHQAAREAFLLWRSNGSPRQGVLFQQMNSTRAQFKLVLRLCKKDRSQKEADSLAKHLLAKDTKQFWKEVKHMAGSKASDPSPTVGGACGADAVCHMWQKHYQGLLNSSSDNTEKDFVLQSLSNLQDQFEIQRFTASDIKDAMKHLQKGKVPGPDSIASEHLLFADERIYYLLSMLFNAMLIHSYLPDKFMLSLIIPLLKDSKGDVTSRDNYRPIALTCILSKVFELIILSRYQHLLATCDNQYGYKPSLSTDICVFTFKEIVNYYKSLSSNVYLCFLDASKAFDRINHWHMCSKLINRGVPKLVVRFLLKWYQTQMFVVKWCNTLSTAFKCTNGLRQGGILSPRMFNVYIDDLSVRLNKSGVGCHMNGISFNHFQYADDSVLLAPSPTALQRMLSICEDYAKSNDMVFNAKKTVCMCMKYKQSTSLSEPKVLLNDSYLKWVSQHKYLGVYISDDMSDDYDLRRHMKSIYSKGNAIIRKFRHCSSNVKVDLFRSYCCNV